MKLKEKALVTNASQLHKISEPVDLYNEIECSRLNTELTTFFYNRNCKMQGLAAIQLGEAKCAFLVRFRKDFVPTVIFNPKVILKIGAFPSIEGCLSEVGRFQVFRPFLTLAKYYDYTAGEWKVRLLGRKKSRIFMHEYDHLQGVLLKDKGIDVTSYMK